jgi:hypothetical protein
LVPVPVPPADDDTEVEDGDVSGTLPVDCVERVGDAEGFAEGDATREADWATEVNTIKKVTMTL